MVIFSSKYDPKMDKLDKQNLTLRISYVIISLSYRRRMTKMKKIICGFITLVITVTLILSLSSCVGIPELDFRMAEISLDRTNYSVDYETDVDDLEAGYLSAFYAEKYSTGDYLVMVEFETTKLAKLYYQSIKMENEAAINSKKQEIKIIEYKLNKFDKELTRDERNDLNDDLRELYNDLADLEDGYSYGINGKIVWYGTTRAIEDSKY